MKYIKISALMYVSSAQRLSELLIRSTFLLVIVYIFSRIWMLTDCSATGLSSEAMIWYLATTELIILSLPLVQIEIENDIRSGDITYVLTKPINYIWLRIAEGFGVLLFRFTTLAPLAFGYATFLSEGWHPPFHFIIIGVGSALLASTILLICHACIGLAAFRLQDCSPLFWLWQRSSFLLGGLILPLEFYPQILRKIAGFTPFPALIYTPARSLVSGSNGSLFDALTVMMFWGVGIVFLTNILYHKALKGVKVNGG